MKSFITKSSVLTLIVFILGGVFYSTLLKQYYLNILPLAVALFYIVTNLVHAYLLKISISSGSRFTSHYMAASFTKMFFYLAVGIAYAIINREDAKIFLVNFLLLYAVYTTFEVVEFSKVVRQKNK
jgi:phosphotransferase system  glucose/maltose/N-acetylglucosamine-specific IIC component